MTVNDTALILGTLKVAYPRFYANISTDEARMAINLWAAMFKEDEKEDVELALNRLIATQTFPPSIAEVRKALHDIQEKRVTDSGEAWGEVVKKIRFFGRYREKEALQDMPEVTRKAVEYIGWNNLCESENEVADRAHFMKIYDAAKTKEIEKKMIPSYIQEKIQLKIKSNAEQQKNLFCQNDCRIQTLPSNVESKENTDSSLCNIKNHFTTVWEILGVKKG